MEQFNEQHPHRGDWLREIVFGLNDGLVTTLADEKRINVFFRLQEPQIIARLRASFPDMGAAPDERTVFLALRTLRNSW